MPDTSQPNSSPKKEPHDHKKVMDAGLKRILIWGSVLLVVLLVFTFAQRAGRIPFFTENLLSLLVLVVIGVQAYIYHRQWEVIERQEKVMREGLEETRNLLRQNEWAFKENHRQANEHTTKLQGQLKATEDQRDAMQGQLKVMQEQTEITRKTMIQQAAFNEAQFDLAGLSMKVSEQNTETVKDSFYITERAYVGIKELEITTNHGDASLSIVWINGGKTPAWHFRCIPALNIGEKPEPKSYLMDDDFSHIRSSFIPAGAERGEVYDDLNFRLTDEAWMRLRGSSDQRLYAVIQGCYRDIRWVNRTFEIWALFDAVKQRFVELESDDEKNKENPN